MERVGVANGTLLYYFTGNNFSTSYYFLLLGALVCVRPPRSEKGKVKVILANVRVFRRLVLCLLLDGAVISVAAIVLLSVPVALKCILTKPQIVIALMITTGSILVVLPQFLRTPLIGYLVIDILGENMALTRRDLIYNGLGTAISQVPIIGHSHGNAAVAMCAGYGNAHNSVMEIIVSYCFLGFLAVLYFVWQSLRGKNDWCRGMFILLYAMIIGSIVEITYNYHFSIPLFLIGVAGIPRVSEIVVSDELEENVDDIWGRKRPVRNATRKKIPVFQSPRENDCVDLTGPVARRTLKMGTF